MNQYFQTMNETYIEKHYPSRSVFKAIAETTKKRSIGVYVFFGLILAGSIAGLMWSMNMTNVYRQSGDIDMAETGAVINAFFVVVVLLSLFVISLTIWRGKRGSGDLLKKGAVKNKLSESEIREFEQQAMASDSYILKLLDGVNAVASTGKDGILTRDFIYLGDVDLTVIPCTAIVLACLIDRVTYIGDQQHRKPVHYLSLHLLSKNGTEAFAEVSPKAGKALIELLLQKYPSIDTCDGRVMTEQEYYKYKESEMAKG